MKQLKVPTTLICAVVLSLVALVIFPSLVSKSSTAQQLTWQDKVDPNVLTAASTGQPEFLIYMNSQADLSGADSLATKEAKGQFVYNQLTATANATQPAVMQTLAQFGVEHQSFWVTNAIWAKGGVAVLQA